MTTISTNTNRNNVRNTTVVTEVQNVIEREESTGAQYEVDFAGKKLNATGNVSLLATNICAFILPSNPSDQCKKSAKFVARHMATNNRTLMILSIRELDLQCVSSVLATGGRVIIFESRGLGQIDFAEFNQFIANDQMLVITPAADDQKWNISSALVRNDVMCKMENVKFFLPECTSVGPKSGVWAMAQKIHENGHDIYMPKWNPALPIENLAVKEMFNVVSFSSNEVNEILFAEAKVEVESAIEE